MKKIKNLKYVIAMMMMALFVSLGNTNNVDAAAKLKVHFVDVGQGDATLVQYGNSYSLIDTGKESNYLDLKDYLKKIGVKKISSLILTHPDSDHIGGADLVIRDYNVKTVYMTGKRAKTREYYEVLNAADNFNAKIKKVTKSDKISFGKLKGDVLSADAKADDSNDSSIIILLKNKKNSFLFTGDASAKLENTITEEYDTNIDVLKVSHHGSGYSSAALFLKKASPKISVISVGKNNSYGHPEKYALKRIKKFSDKVYRTDENGTVVVTSNGDKLKVSTMGANTNKSSKTSTKSSSTSKSSSSSSNSAKYSSTTTSSSTTSSTTVYITNTGSKYHEAGCRYLSSSKISISLTDAKNKGYTPCSFCH